MPTIQDRSELWLALLRRLTPLDERWAVAGDVAEGYAGEGDVDLVVPASDLDRVTHEFTSWAQRSGIGPVVACRHRPGALILVALGAPGEPLFELEVRFERYFKGWTMWRAEDLAPFLRMDPDGYRRLRPGAAGLLKLVPNGLRAGGRAKWPPAKRARVAERLRRDPEGVAAAARLLGPARRAAIAGAEAAARDRWDRRAMLVVEGWAYLRGLGEVRTLAARLRFRTASGPPCVVLRTIGESGRVIEGDPETWLEEAARDHDMPARHSGG